MTLGSHQRAVGRSQDWITPKVIIEALGPFDLDPCASRIQPWPCAAESWTENGLSYQWHGFVWLNPPFDRYEVGAWVERMAGHDHGIALLHARTEAAWFMPVWDAASAIGFLHDRLYFHRPDGSRGLRRCWSPSENRRGVGCCTRKSRCRS